LIEVEGSSLTLANIESIACKDNTREQFETKHGANILSIEKGRVTFRYQDSKTKRYKPRTLQGQMTKDIQQESRLCSHQRIIIRMNRRAKCCPIAKSYLHS